MTYQAVGSLNWSVIGTCFTLRPRHVSFGAKLTFIPLAEVGTALICASLSALRPLATNFFPALFAPFSHPTGLSRITTKTSQSHPKFEILTPPVSRGSGHIHVQKTFDVLELSQLPSTPSRARIRSGNIYAGETYFSERSSEDDLVVRS